MKATTTPNVARARARKLRNRSIRREAQQAEADRLGISVTELQFRKSQEAARIIADSATHFSLLRKYVDSNPRCRY